ncbi:hypothetical protein [uncultured Mediterranean phage uvMED]|nr:hypothetical protein [uncultured Mediterranean phage uvMED]
MKNDLLNKGDKIVVGSRVQVVCEFSSCTTNGLIGEVIGDQGNLISLKLPNGRYLTKKKSLCRLVGSFSEAELSILKRKD